MTSTMHQIPSGASLHQLALDTAARCGVDVDAIAGDVVNTSPVNGQRLVDLGWVDGLDRRRHGRAGAGRLPAVASGAGPGARRPGQAAGRAARRAQGRRGDPDQPRGRQDHLRGARRGPGDDRHLRLRRRSLPPALRPDDDLRATRPPADGDLAPARRRRRDQRVQLPRSRVVVEHRDRPGLRRPGHLEAVGARTADRPRQPRDPGPGDRRLRRADRPEPGADRRRRRRAGARGPRRGRPAQRDRLHPDGTRGRTARRRPVRSFAARARRQQRRGRRARRPTST